MLKLADTFSCEVVLSKEEGAAYAVFSGYRPQFYFRTTDDWELCCRRVRDGDARGQHRRRHAIALIAMEEGCAAIREAARRRWRRRQDIE